MLVVQNKAKANTPTQSSTRLGALMLSVLLLSCACFAVGCSNNSDEPAQASDSRASAAAQNEDEAVDTAEEPRSNASSQEGLPASFTAYGNPYSVTSYSIDLNDEGNTVVTCEGTGFEVLPMREGSFRMPLSCKLIVDGVAQNWTGGGVANGTLEFEFEGALEPEKLILTAGDDDTQKIELNVE